MNSEDSPGAITQSLELLPVMLGGWVAVSIIGFIAGIQTLENIATLLFVFTAGWAVATVFFISMEYLEEQRAA